jgi:NAD(P)-dependent dehydrogenase (short-subunit alcohol dehydrogenase family)
MAQELAGKVAIVTGGVSGIGRGIVEIFVEEGARVVVGDIDIEGGQALQSEFGDSLLFMPADVTVEPDVENLVAGAVQRFGELNVMVNNAGALGDQSSFFDITAEGFTATTDLLLRPVILGHKYAARQMRTQGKGGSIVSMSSVAGIQGGWSGPAYDAAKAGVLQVPRTAAFELARYRIRSNVILPGLILTPIMAKGTTLAKEQYPAYVEALRQPMGELHPMGRCGLPRDIGNAVLYLASDRSEFVTGQHFSVDGGLTSIANHDMGAVVAKAFTAMGIHDIDPNFSSAAKLDNA